MTADFGDRELIHKFSRIYKDAWEGYPMASCTERNGHSLQERETDDNFYYKITKEAISPLSDKFDYGYFLTLV